MKAVHLFLVLLASTCVAQAQATATLATANLSADDRRQILTVIEQSAFDVPESWEDELRVTEVDLGSSRGLILRGTQLLCGATGNCQLFVVRRTGNRWFSLFGNEQAPLAQSFTFGPTITRGIKDLTVVTNSSAIADQRLTFRFDGQVYRQISK